MIGQVRVLRKISDLNGMAGAKRELGPLRHGGVVPYDRAAGPHSHQS